MLQWLLYFLAFRHCARQRSRTVKGQVLQYLFNSFVSWQ